MRKPPHSFLKGKFRAVTKLGLWCGGMVRDGSLQIDQPDMVWLT